MESPASRAVVVTFLNAREAFEDPAQAAAWWGGVHREATSAVRLRASPKPRFDFTLTEELQNLRTAAVQALDAASRGLEPPASSLASIGEALARGRLGLDGAPPALTYSVADGAGSVLLPLAYIVCALLEADLRRLRRCADERCGAYFWDTTKNRSRRWCRLACMERVRAPRRRLP
ncbi:MAG TPA: CGNR zinc finger domain-containing protein [Candidatus Rubrimentiphilum sp.]|nr:CGNR zinc finger domain-containing protein [Candidatus Rubrimentiphilum sp.]